MGFVTLVLMLCGCMSLNTSYSSIDPMELGFNINTAPYFNGRCYSIYGHGMPWESASRIRSQTMQRAATLAWNNGFDYFAVVDEVRGSYSYTDNSASATTTVYGNTATTNVQGPSTYTYQQNSLLVMFFTDDEVAGGAWDKFKSGFDGGIGLYSVAKYLPPDYANNYPKGIKQQDVLLDYYGRLLPIVDGDDSFSTSDAIVQLTKLHYVISNSTYGINKGINDVFNVDLQSLLVNARWYKNISLAESVKSMMSKNGAIYSATYANDGISDYIIVNQNLQGQYYITTFYPTRK